MDCLASLQCFGAARQVAKNNPLKTQNPINPGSRCLGFSCLPCGPGRAACPKSGRASAGRRCCLGHSAFSHMGVSEIRGTRLTAETWLQKGVRYWGPYGKGIVFFWGLYWESLIFANPNVVCSSLGGKGRNMELAYSGCVPCADGRCRNSYCRYFAHICWRCHI